MTALALDRLDIIQDVSKDADGFVYIPNSTTVYVGVSNLTHLDSVHGITLWMLGLRWGVNDVTVTIQHTHDPRGTWADIAVGSTFGTGGTEGSPNAAELAIVNNPTSPAVLRQYFRVKIVTGADAFAKIKYMTRTRRGGTV